MQKNGEKEGRTETDKRTNARRVFLGQLLRATMLAKTFSNDRMLHIATFSATWLWIEERQPFLDSATKRNQSSLTENNKPCLQAFLRNESCRAQRWEALYSPMAQCYPQQGSCDAPRCATESTSAITREKSCNLLSRRCWFWWTSIKTFPEHSAP